MKRLFLPAAALFTGCAILPAQDSGLQQRLAEVKQSIAENRERLKTYQWVETTELSLKGEIKNRVQKECRYGPDGEIQKTPIGAPSEPKKQPRGIKKRVAGKKVEEFQDYMERFGSLISRYVPPDAAKMQEAFQSGKASLDTSSGDGIASLVFNDYAKPGDRVAFTFDTVAKKLRNFRVNSYLDGPEDAVGLDARFATLHDGTSYVEETVLTSASKQMQIKTTNFDHRPAGQ